MDLETLLPLYWLLLFLAMVGAIRIWYRPVSRAPAIQTLSRRQFLQVHAEWGIDPKYVYYAPSVAKVTLGPVWFIWLLSFRDKATRSWGRHCLDLGLIRDGGLIPLLSRRLQYGWH